MKHFYFFLALPAFTFSATNMVGQCVEISADTEELFCPGEEITLTATPGFNTYSWYYNFSDSNEGGELLTESGSDNTITISASEWAVSYIYVEVDDDGCTDPSPTVVWNSWVFGSIAISHEFNTTICPGDSSLIANAFNGPVNFQWSRDFEPIEGANSSSYWVTEPGTYTLQASYAECPDFWLNSGLGPTFDFYDVQIPVLNFTIIGGQPQLSVSSGVNIQWYLDGEALFGANTNSMVLFANGAWSVTATDQNGCQVASEAYIYTTLSAEKPLQEIKFEVYPNPFQNEIFITSDANHSNGFIRIFDLTGKQVSSQRMMANASQTAINLGHLNNGVYLLEITFEDGIKEVLKLVKSS